MTNINWDGDAASAPFKSRFDDASGNLILAETDTGTALFEWDGSAWQFRGPVEMNGEDVSGIGSLTATSANFDSVNTELTTTENVGSVHKTTERKNLESSIEPLRTRTTDTVTVEQSNVLIYDVESRGIGAVFVFGVDPDDLSRAFVDLVGYNDNTSTDQTVILDNTSSVRDYNASFSDLVMSIDSGSYRVVAEGMDVRP